MKKGSFRFALLITLPALVGMACGLSNLPNPFATATPTPTSTYTPSPTPTSTPTNTPTATPLPTGVIVEDHPDGGSLLTDYDGGYQLSIPSDWLVVIARAEDIESMVEAFPADSDMRPLLEAFKNSNDETLRAFGFNLKNISLEYSPNISIGYRADASLSRLGIEDLLELFEQLLPSVIPDMQILDSNIFNTSSGIEVGYLKFTWETDLAQGQHLKVRQKQYYVKSGKGLITLTLTESQDAEVDLEENFDQIVDSIMFLD